MRRHDGVYRWHRIHNRPIRFADRIEYWLGTAVDIDDIRHANERLEQSVTERTAELESANRRLAAQIEEREDGESRCAQRKDSQREELENGWHAAHGRYSTGLPVTTCSAVRSPR